MNWKKRFEEPHKGSKVKVIKINPIQGYPIGKILTLNEKYIEDETGNYWSTEENPGLGIEESNFMVIG